MDSQGGEEENLGSYGDEHEYTENKSEKEV